MDYIFAHFAQSLVVLGLIFLAIEILVLGFSTFVLFFIGIGCIITGLLVLFAIIPSTGLAALLSIAISAALVALITWRPMKRVQNQVHAKQVDNDMIGHRFMLPADLSPGEPIDHHYSGIIWKVQARQALPKGCEVKIIHMQVGLLTVEKVDQ